jgi:hypothetical protein
VCVIRALVKKNENNFADFRFVAVQVGGDSLKGDGGCIGDGVSINASADGWKTDGSDAVRFG